MMTFLETTDDNDAKLNVKWHTKHYLAVWWTTGGGWGLHMLRPPAENVSGFLMLPQDLRGTYPDTPPAAISTFFIVISIIKTIINMIKSRRHALSN